MDVNSDGALPALPPYENTGIASITICDRESFLRKMVAGVGIEPTTRGFSKFHLQTIRKYFNYLFRRNLGATQVRQASIFVSDGAFLDADSLLSGSNVVYTTIKVLTISCLEVRPDTVNHSGDHLPDRRLRSRKLDSPRQRLYGSRLRLIARARVIFVPFTVCLRRSYAHCRPGSLP